MKKLYTTITCLLCLAIVCSVTGVYAALSQRDSAPAMLLRDSSRRATAIQTPDYNPQAPARGVKAAAPSYDEGLVFYGLLRENNSWPLPNPGVYSFKPFASDWAITPLKTGESYSDYTYCGTRGGVYANGKLYVINNNTSKLTAFDTNTWEMTEIASIGGSASGQWATDLAWDPVADVVYGCFITGWDEYAFGTMDLATAQVTRIKDLGEFYFHALAANMAGDLYGIGTDGVFYSIDKSTGAYTRVGATGLTGLDKYFSTTYAQDAVFDPASGRLFWFNNIPSFPVLYEIDVTTGTATYVGTTPKASKFGTVFIPFEVESPDAPAFVTDLKVTFTDVQGHGTASFKLPETTSDGNPLEGTLSYEVKIGSDVLATGSGTTGESKSADIATSQKGEVTVDVTVTTAGGKKSTTSATAWAGPDTPAAVTDIATAVSADHRTVSLTWQAPATGAHGGAIDAPALRYRVVRMPGEVEIASALSTTHIDDTPATNNYTAYTYHVTTVANDLTGATAESAPVCLGPSMTLPYREDFSDAAGFGLMSVTDVHADGATWTRYASNDTDGEAYAQCEMSEDNPKDDWLALPPMALTAGTQYVLTFSASGFMVSFPEILEVKAGRTAAPADMKLEILSQRKIENVMSWTWYTYVCTFEVPESGDWYIGFHGMSPAGRFRIGIDDITLDGASKDAPAAVTDLRAQPAAGGAQSATVTFTVPSRTQGGQNITSGITAEIILNSTVVKTLRNLRPGSAVSETISTAEGSNDVTVLCSNDAGMSLPARCTVYTGVDSPGAVRNLTARVSGDDVTLTWEAPEGLNGGYVDPATITYTVVRYMSSEDYEMWGPVSELTYTDHYTSDSQTLLTYLVYAHQAGTTDFSPAAMANSVVAGGEHYKLPFIETFDQGFCSKVCGVVSIDAARSVWALWQENSENETANPQDDDYGCIYFDPYKSGESARYFSGNISLAGADNPVLSLWVNPTQSRGKLNIDIAAEGGNWRTVKSIDFSTARLSGWNRIEIPLTGYKSKEFIQFSLAATSSDELGRIYADNMSIVDLRDNDLSLEADMRHTFYLDTDNEIRLTVANEGTRKAGGYEITLYRDDQPVKTFAGPDLEPGGKVTYTHIEKISVESPFTAVYRAEIDRADENEANNATAPVTVKNLIERFPAPDGLTATADSEGNARLAWSRPADPENKSLGTVTDSFEDYESFIINDMGDWEIVDVDGEDGTFPIIQAWYPHMREPKAWMVWNLWDLSADADNTTTWNPVTGHQMLVSFCDRDNQNDDWLISPELDGTAQTVTFHAKALSILYGDEPFEMYYSTTGRAIADFVKATPGEGSVSVDWTKFSFDVPRGARFFAIRRVGSGTVLCLDDITYSAGNGIPVDLVLEGYNIYRDGQKLNDAPLAATDFADRLPDAFTHTYSVSAVYNHGESRSSARVATSSGEAGLTDAAASAVAVYVADGTITVENAAGMALRLYSADGVLRHSSTGTGHDAIAAAPSIYVLCAGADTYKLHVK